MRDEEGEEKSENERSDYVQMSLGKWLVANVAYLSIIFSYLL